MNAVNKTEAEIEAENMFDFCSTDEYFAEEAAIKERRLAEFNRCVSHYLAIFSDKAAYMRKIECDSKVHSIGLRFGLQKVVAALEATINNTRNADQDEIIDELIFTL